VNACAGVTDNELELADVLAMYNRCKELEARLAACKDRYCLGCDMVLKPSPLKDQYARIEAQNKELREERAELGRLADKLGDDESVFEEFIAKVNSLREKDKALSGGG